jgi:hypothetical protein
MAKVVFAKDFCAVYFGCTAAMQQAVAVIHVP